MTLCHLKVAGLAAIGTVVLAVDAEADSFLPVAKAAVAVARAAVFRFVTL
jgi:hypothetical protein